MQKTEGQTVPIEVYQEALSKIARLEDRLAWLERQIFGSKSERFEDGTLPGQLTLELGGLEATQTEEAHKQEIAAHERRVAKETEHPGRHPLPDHFERRTTIIEPQEDTTGMRYIGEEVREWLEYEPPKIIIIEERYRKYARPDVSDPNAATGSQVVKAPLRDRPFPRFKAGVSLLVHILIAKFVDHLPLYRIARQFARLGLVVQDSTMADWVKHSAQRLEVLYQAQKKVLLTSGYVQMDETTLKVLEEGKKGKSHLGYLWAVFDPVRKLPFFFYQRGRSHHSPKELLQDFAGYLQSDGFSVYELLHKHLAAITLAGCMAHARRKFFEAQTNDKTRATTVLKIIADLYLVERQARDQDLDYDARLKLRQEKSLPLFEELGRYLRTQGAEMLPQSKIGAAVRYSLDRWENLGRFLTDGRLEIDNNLVENIIRPAALGRKNYLFAGSHDAAQRIAMLYTFFAACKHHNINPQDWLADVLNRIHLHPVNRIEELLPHIWKPPMEHEGIIEN